MNIKDAKEQIENALSVYSEKDNHGHYVVPKEKQRPIFLVGPPGIGKTAIMEQIAHEMPLPLLCYSMTHHTRQSALGLPFITKKEYNGTQYSISEYTMSEIIAAIYEMQANSGVQEGILFLDEINCVSETLAPIMLQFLQYKVFGRYSVPDGWMIVTAGNPPEYNDSVRPFDVATLDRLKRITVEPDYQTWKEYAYSVGIHQSILSYLDIKKDRFYFVKATLDGKKFVTARGWEDLSIMLRMYEKKQLKVDIKLIGQYLQDEDTARDFAIYYDLFCKYQDDYQVESILQGNAQQEVKDRAINAAFDERLLLVSLLLSALDTDIRAVLWQESLTRDFKTVLQQVIATLQQPDSDAEKEFSVLIAQKKKTYKERTDVGTLSKTDRDHLLDLISLLEECASLVKCCASTADMRNKLKAKYSSEVEKLKEQVQKASTELSNCFQFCEEIFGDGQEMLVLVTELTLNSYSATYISHYGCDEYYKHNKNLQFYERQKEINKLINDVNL